MKYRVMFGLALAVALATAEDPGSPVALSELKGKYKGEDGGLYGGGQNEPSESHRKLALAEAARIRPLDAGGKPAAGGRIVFLSIGMSNTSQEFEAFQGAARGATAPAVLLVNGAQGGMDATKWVENAANRQSGKPVWDEAVARVRAAGASPEQVQAGWVKQAHSGPQKHGEFPKHARRLADDLGAIAREAKKRFPNLRILYLSSRTYAGHAKVQLNPEPYAYEGAFSVRWAIEEQAKGEAALNADEAKGEVKAPVLLWGPYVWDSSWPAEEFTEKDGTHPSESGRRKVAELLLKFLEAGETSKGWFSKK
jgi:hypothetical protein